MSVLYSILSWIMNGCYEICNNYGFAIILFTLCSKIVLLPVSVWTQMNSIKMIKMQPAINFLKVRFYGDKDTIAEEQAKLFKQEKYNPLASTVPLIIQIILLMGVIEVIKMGMADSSINMDFFGVQLGLVPSENGIALIWSPLLAGLSALFLCLAQNASNVLQSEQTKANKYGTMIFSVSLSLYLGWFVPIGVALYWIVSNLMAVIQLYILNAIIQPRKYVDYAQLEKSRKALAELKDVGTGKKRSFFDEESKRERADYKRFFSVVNKHLVFYSESNGFYKYFKGIIEYLLENTNITIHYITSDPNDNIFEMEKKHSQIRAYYIGEKRLITLMMKMEADIVVMTMPDLENYHIKRSYIRDDIEYIFIPHGIGSNNLTMRTGCVDHFDTIFCAGPHQKEEVEKTEIVYGLPKKHLVEWGYCLLDEMKKNYLANPPAEKEKKNILIAPSWQPDNIVDNCLEELLDQLRGMGYQVVVRPHPQHVRHRGEYMERLKNKYKDDSDIEIQTDFSSNNPVLEADLLISDWSGIVWEYSFTTQKPVLFINTPMKVMNPEYKKIDTIPLNIALRDVIGCSIDLDELDKVPQYVEKLFNEKDIYYDRIGQIVKKYIYNLGTSAEVGAEYIIDSLRKKVKNKGNNKKK